MGTNENVENGKSATGWLIAIFIFAVLGGLLGLIFGIMVYRNHSYRESDRKLALVGAILSVVSFFLWAFVAA